MLKTRMIALASVAVILPTVPAWAQSQQTGNGSAEPARQASPEATSSAPAPQAAASAGDIVVTARRREERLQDVPISITAVSGDTLRAQGTTELATLPVPSLTVSNGGVQRAAFTFAIRGQRTNEIQLLTDPPVGTYFAEVVQPRPFGFGDTLYDIQSIQVLKGVQGTLFGRNVTGGAVVITPNRPTDKLEGELRGQYGSFDNRQLYGMLNLPFSGDAGGLRVSGQLRKRDGFTTDISNGRGYDDIDYKSFRASFLGRHGAFETLTIGDYYRSTTHGSATIPTNITLANPCNKVNIACPTGAPVGTVIPTVLGQLEGLRLFGNPAAGLPPQSQFPNVPAQFAAIQTARQNNFYSFNPGAGDGGSDDAFGRQPYANLRNVGVTNISTLDLGFGKLKNIFGYRDIDYSRLTDLDGLQAFLINSVQETHLKQFSEELQLNGSALGKRLNYTVGGYYFLERGTDGSTASQFAPLTALGIAQALGTNFGVRLTPQQFGAILSTPASTYLNDVQGFGRALTYAGYAAGTFKFTDKLSVAGGIRYTYDKRTAVVTNLLPNITNINNSSIPGFTALPQLAFLTCNYNPTGPDASRGITKTGACSYQNSKSWDAVTYDVTLQYEPSSNLTAYLSTRRGFRAGGFSLRASSNETFQPFNPETVQEYEAGLKNRFDLGFGILNTDVAVFYQDYKNVQKQNPILVGGQVATITTNTASQENYGGEVQANLSTRSGVYASAFYSYVQAKVKSGGNGSFALVGVPHHQAGAALGYAREYGWGKLNANVNVNYKSLQHLDDYDVQGDQKAYAIANARIGIDNIGHSGIGAAVFVSNFTDKKYKVGVLGLGDTVGYDGALYGDPRQWGGEISFKF